MKKSDRKSVLITGISGQDGRLLGEFLFRKGYQVFGITRNLAQAATVTMPYVEIEYLEWDFRDHKKLESYLEKFAPDEFYNFAGFATGTGMYEDALDMVDVNAKLVVSIIEAIRSVSPKTRFCQASSSEMFGHCKVSPQDEFTPFTPRSPYGAAKLLGHNMINIYREKYNIFATSAILYNHESYLRTENFISRKISSGVAKIKLGLASELVVGNFESIRDWGYALDYVRGMWLILQAKDPSDYVLATGVSHTVRDMCKIAFEHVGLDYKNFVKTNSANFRPSEIVPLIGNPAKAFKDLGWQTEVTFEKMIRSMVDFDIALLERSMEKK